MVKYATLHFDVATFPMQFISMDLIGEFHPPTTKGKRYVLTVICMLTGYVFCIPLKTKIAEEALQVSWRTVVFSGTVHLLYLKTSFHPLLWTSSGDLMKSTVVDER